MKLSPDNYLDPSDAWDLIKMNALNIQGFTNALSSAKRKNGYTVTKVTEDRITIKPETTTVTRDLARIQLERAIHRLNAHDGFIRRNELIGNVARETAVVSLHPRLEWSDDLSFILISDAPKPAILNIKKMREFAEAPDDFPEYQLYARKIRAGQAALRRKLLEVYDHKCCVTGTGPDNVLEAAHIVPHAVSGVNNTVNVLLLRSDIHNLFDDGLLAIHPEKLKVYIHTELNNTVYANFRGIRISERNDNKRPEEKYLRLRWENLGFEEG